MSALVVDTHAHLADPALFCRLDDVIENAKAAGVARILAVGINVESSAESVRLAHRFSSVYAAVGIHPQNAGRYDAAMLADVRQLATQPKVVAIGEIGLDYHHAEASPEIQQRAFRDQLDFAASINLPVVVHDREAHEDVLRLIAEVPRGDSLKTRGGVLHCFSGDEALARQAIDHGFFISFAGNVTFRRADSLRAVAAAIPAERILTETDSPYLSPVPFRGRENEPARVRLVVECLAETRGETISTLDDETVENARQLFAWG